MSLHVVLVHPEIHWNTGNAGRTCLATGATLHLVEPLGFSLDEKQVKRAGLDYWPALELSLHATAEDFLAERAQRGGRLLGFSSHAKHSYDAVAFSADDWLLFGCESDGLSERVLHQADVCLTIPMPGNILGSDHPGVRSLNLSVSVAVGLYEALRQLKQLDPPSPDAQKME